ncbi:unnamed protein product, partial [Rotaria sp. Silwood1]
MGIIQEETNSVKPKQISNYSIDEHPAIDLNGDIQFDNVSFAYPARPDILALRDLTLVARAGEITALVGSSGSGKSTCVSLLLRYYEPSSGRITIDGQSITDCNDNALRQKIGVVGQEPVLFDTTIYENIRYGQLHATKGEIEEAAKQANAHDFIMKLSQQYETIVGEQSVQLSGGEKQRIALARALLKKPNLLLLDEPTSALDNASEKIVQEALECSCAGRTTIVIAHRLKTIQNAHRIYVFANGNIIEQGTHATLVAKKDSKYRQMMEAQQVERTENEIDERVLGVQLEQNQNQTRIGVLASRVIQHTAFSVSGSKLTQRIRAKAFAQLLRQEMAYFDLPENRSGSVCNRLSSEALAIQELLGARLGLAAEVLRNMRTVKQLSIEDKLLQQFSNLVNQTFTVRRNDIIISGLLRGIYWGSQTLLLFMLYWIALIRLEHKQIQANDALMVFAFAAFALETLRFISTLTRQMSSSLSAAQVFFDLFDRTPIIDNCSADGRQLDNFHGQIKFNQVEFGYPSRSTSRVLNQFQLTIEPSGSGCGKSTVIQLLERFYDVTHGQICLDGVDIRELNIHWLRSQFSLVNQEPVLFDMTIAENIAYGEENSSLEDIIEAATKANIHQFIMQLPQVMGAKGSHLSGGQKQRIAIARALFRRPKILLLDEATSAMDSHNEQIVQQALEQAQTEDPTRISLIIAHRLSTIRSCDVIYVLD